MSICSIEIVEGDAWPGRGLDKRIEVDADDVDEADAVRRARRRGPPACARRARMPPWIFGCSVLTRPSIISGKPVTSDTCTTARPASASALAVPPVDTSSKPACSTPPQSRISRPSCRTHSKSLVACCSSRSRNTPWPPVEAAEQAAQSCELNPSIHFVEYPSAQLPPICACFANHHAAGVSTQPSYGVNRRPGRPRPPKAGPRRASVGPGVPKDARFR